MSALQAEVVAPLRQPLTISRPGKVLAWQVSVGDKVQQGQNVALFDDGGGAIQITAPYAARVATLLHAGFPVAAGAAIAQLEPDERPEPLKRAAPITPPQHTAPPPKAPPAPSGEVLEASAEVPRRSTLGDEEQLVKVEELSLPIPLPKPKARARPPRMARRTTRPTDHQKDDFQGRAERFKKLGYDIGEMDRLMYDLILRLADHDIVRELEAQRDKEQAGRYCFGNRPVG